MYLWNEYCRIRKGCSCVDWQVLDSYCERSGVNLSPWESELMLDIDLIRRKHE